MKRVEMVGTRLAKTRCMGDLAALATFVTDEAFRVVVESPRGSHVKLKYEPESRTMSLSRPLTAGLAYPYDWGFVPSTRGPDGDPLDVIVMWDATSYPGLVLACRPIGVLQVEQTNPSSHERERNDRLAALPLNAPRWEPVRSVFDVSERIRLELEQFFLFAVAFEGRDLKILGWGNPTDALELVRSAQQQVAHGKR